jgi:hypothetical protein
MEQAECHLLISQARRANVVGPLEEISRPINQQVEAVEICFSRATTESIEVLIVRIVLLPRSSPAM